MERNESSQGSSRNIAVGFSIERRNSSVNVVLRLERKSFMKPKKHRVKRLISSVPWHAVFAFLNPLLIGAIQVKLQQNDPSPFKTHPTYMWTFLLATLVYCFAFAANTKCYHKRTPYARFSGHMALISGSLSSVSLFSIFLPKVLGLLIFFSWIILPLLVFRKFIIYWPFQWTRRAVFLVVGNIRKKCNINDGIYLDDQRPRSVPV